MENKEKPKMSELITRSFAEFKVNDNEDKNIGVLVGTPIVFETPTDIGGMFQETIARGAINESVLKDVAFFFNHDLNGKRLASTRNKTMDLKIDENGVQMEARLNLERTDSKDLYLAIKDGEIGEMSFAFRIEDETWSDLDTDYPKRRINKIGYVQEVSACNWGAYSSTEIYARSQEFLDKNLKALDNARAAAVDTADDEKRQLELAKLKLQLIAEGGM